MKNVIHLLITKAENFEAKAKGNRRIAVSPTAWEGYKKEAERLEALAKECRDAADILKRLPPPAEAKHKPNCLCPDCRDFYLDA
jgi:hypothetical protein